MIGSLSHSAFPQPPRPDVQGLARCGGALLSKARRTASTTQFTSLMRLAQAGLAAAGGMTERF